MKLDTDFELVLFPLLRIVCIDPFSAVNLPFSIHYFQYRNDFYFSPFPSFLGLLDILFLKLQLSIFFPLFLKHTKQEEAGFCDLVYYTSILYIYYDLKLFVQNSSSEYNLFWNHWIAMEV